MTNRNRLTPGLCVWLGLWTAAAGVHAQSLAAKPGVENSHTQTQKQRSGRFLARRGIGPQRVYPQSAAPRSAAEMLAQARAQHHVMELQRDPGGGSTSLTAPWQPVGPAQVMTSTFGAVTGRVSSIAADPSDPSGNVVYVGTTGGGVWKSVNAAGNPAQVSFTPLTDTLSSYAGVNIVSLSIGAVTVQPGGTGVVLAGTGDPNDATDSYYGAGILRSSDNGLIWSLVSSSSDRTVGGESNYQFVGNGFAGFAWSTTNPNLVVAAVSQAAEGTEVNAAVNASLAGTSVMGLYYSSDAGQSWYLATISDSTNSIVQSNQTNFSTTGNAATAVVWNPIRQMFYAAVRFHGYYQSPDGVNWTRLANQPGTGMTTAYCPTNAGSTGSPACPIFRGALAAQPVTGDLFALTTDVNNLDQGLWQDVCALNAGACSSATVTFANQIADTPLEAGNGDTTIPQADYNLYLAAVPSQQDTLLFAGTADIFRCSLANACAWRNTTNSGGCQSASVAWAQHAIDVTQGGQGLMYFGNDGGLWRTTDAVNQQQPPCSADDATHYQNLNGGLGSLAEVEDLANDANSPLNMMASLGALGTAAATSSVTTGAWPQVLDGEGNYAAIDPATATNWYATSMFGLAIDRCTEGASCNEAGFAPAIGSTQVGGDGDQQTIPTPWILDPQDTANLIVGTCRVWRGPAAGGSSWTGGNLLSPMLDQVTGPYCDGNAEIRSLAASGSAADAPGTPEQIYVGMAGLLDGGETVPGHIFTASVTNSSGATTPWVDLFHRPVTNGGSSNSQFNPGGFDISGIYVDPHDSTGETVYATVQGFSGNGVVEALLYGSTNGGAVWSNLTANLPNAPANSIVIDPNDANTAYVAMDTGVYVTRNVWSCANPFISCWSVFGTSLPNAPVIQPTTVNEASTSVLRAATYGRGTWQIGLVTAGTALTTAVANPSSLSFPNLQLQSQSAAQTVAVINSGKITMNVTQVSITGDFAETDDCANNAVLPGDACTLNVTFTPSQTGQRPGVLTVYGNIAGGAGSGQVTVQLTGTGVAGPAVVLTPSSLSFPQTLLGKTAQAQNVTVSNTGGAAATLTSEKATGDFAITANTCGASLAADTGCTLSIAYTPMVSGPETGTVTVIDSSGTQTVQLSGTGESPATDSLAPLNLAFPPQAIGWTGITQQLKLTNDGDQALSLISIQLSGDFSAVNQCGPSLAGHSSCAIVVTFVPTQLGTESGTIIVTDILRSQTVTLTGTGVAPPSISASLLSVVFGTYTVGHSSPAQFVTLTNSGGIPLTSLAYTLTGDFSIPPGASTCGPALAVGASCQVGLVFTPSQAGQLTGRLTVTGAELSKPLLVALSGTGVPQSGIYATPQSISFGSDAVGQTSATQFVTLTNNAGVTLTHLASAVTGDFIMPSAGNTCGATLAVGAQCQIGVAFQPSQGGLRSGIFSVTATELSQALVVSLSGTGLVAPAIAASAGSINFGNSLMAQTSTAQTVTLANTGGVALTNLTPTVTGDFALQTGAGSCGATLPVGSSCPVSLTFTPTQPGVRTGILMIGADELATPITIALTGDGETFTLSVSGQASQTITSGQTATYMLEITPVGLTGSSQLVIDLACATQPQVQNATCTLNPSSLKVSGQNQDTVTVTIATGVAPATAFTNTSSRRWPGLKPLGMSLAAVLPIGFLARRRRKWMPLILLAVLALALPGCNLKVIPGTSSSTTTSTGTTPPANQTPSGLYTLTVTGTVTGPPGTLALVNSVNPPLTLTVE